ncbi:MAG: hypothetical protein HGA45_35870 [Chloroflexales bacterium]|nr:hypothetical protein [Chloroflexales bacterium]
MTSPKQLPAEEIPVEVHQAIALDAERFPTWESFYQEQLKLDIQPPDAPAHTLTIRVAIPNPNEREELMEAARQRAAAT